MQQPADTQRIRQLLQTLLRSRFLREGRRQQKVFADAQRSDKMRLLEYQPDILSLKASMAADLSRGREVFPTRTSPEAGLSRPASRCKSVVFPGAGRPRDEQRLAAFAGKVRELQQTPVGDGHMQDFRCRSYLVLFLKSNDVAFTPLRMAKIALPAEKFY